MSQALNDMEFIKTEWERKLQEVQAKAQQQIVDFTLFAII